MARVVLENVSKVFPRAKGETICAVNNVSLAVENKEFLVLVGPSGCGKSTTLRMIAGLEDVSNGAIRIDDQLMNAVEPKDRDVAMVFQNYALYPHMSVFENMALGLKLRKVPKPEIERRVKETAETLGLTSRLASKPSALSGGERQRVAVGRALVRKPKVFLFDEPLSNLDAPLRTLMRAEIAKLRARIEATMIYVTHDQVEAMTMGDRIAVMEAGVIQQVADPITVYNYPVNLFVAAFIGSPPMSFFKGSLIEAQSRFWFEAQEASGGPGLGKFAVPLDGSRGSPFSDYAGKNIVLGLRPEDISIRPGSANAITARVEAVEPMGSETVLYLRAGLHSFVASAKAGDRFKPGEVVSASLDMSKAHFFDVQTEETIV